MLQLVIGNKNYSSWSLRAWLHLRESGVAFEEIRISLFSGGRWRDELARFTPAGRVPVLVDGDLAVWDSLAIHEYVAETCPGAVGWPDEARARAVARSVVAEMHAGFPAIRGELPQNLRRREPFDVGRLSGACRREIERVDRLWSDALATYGRHGPWLFGDLSIADIVFAPVALRFATYAIPLSPAAQGFVGQVQSLASIGEWRRDAEAEPERIAFVEAVGRATATPISGFDHVALPASDPEALIDFYGRLGFRVPDLAAWREAGVPFFSVFFGDQKINFHAPDLWQSASFTLRGPTAAPGCGDLCFVWDGGADALETLLASLDTPVVAGPLDMTGARGRGRSVYVRDPEQNLLEFIVYPEEDPGIS